jgi:mono/diheme cytochrome c family protein
MKSSLLGLLCAGSLLAQEPAGDAVFRRYDRNGDGKVTPEEFPLPKIFAKFDVNHDGIITLEEYRKVAGLSSAVPADELAALKAPGPLIQKPGDLGVGRLISDAAFTDLSGQGRRLSAYKASKGLVLALTSSTCPVSKRTLPSLVALDASLQAQGITLILVNPYASETPADIQAQLKAAGYHGLYVHDKDMGLCRALGARTTTEVFLLDATRTLLYRGALDDQYGTNYNREAPQHTYLKDAVADFLAGRAVTTGATSAPGCELDLGPKPTATPTQVTYYRDVARILQQNCVGCHHGGGIAPFALDSLTGVKDRTKVIRRVVSQGLMPPWFAAPEAPGKPNPWANDCSLSEKDKADLLAWIDSPDRPLGDPADAPRRLVYPTEWSIGQPDLIIPLSKAYDIKATGYMPYQRDVVQTTLTEDKWISAFEILPSARDVVHHVIVTVHEKNEKVADTESYWAAYVPGNGAHTFPEGFARKLPAGAKLSFQIHYTPNGTATKERLRLGLVYAKTPPKYEMRTVAVPNVFLKIPPGAANHVETVTRPVPVDLPVTSLLAHMHVRGKAFKFELTTPDGKTETLLDLPNYDFNWQLRYDLKQPRVLPRGSTVKLTAVFDNSADNKSNPDPTRLVRWGPQTYDEMMIGYFEYFVPVNR